MSSIALDGSWNIFETFATENVATCATIGMIDGGLGRTFERRGRGDRKIIDTFCIVVHKPKCMALLQRRLVQDIYEFYPGVDKQHGALRVTAADSDFVGR